MSKDPRIWLLTGDLGYKLWDQIRNDFPNRFLNPGAAEQVMLDISVGLSLEGKIPFVYSITPFLIYRPFETLRTYINHESLNVKLVGGGRDKDYLHDGISHDATDVPEILSTLKNIHQFYPIDIPTMQMNLEDMLECKGPDFISLKK
jgi:transketolase